MIKKYLKGVVFAASYLAGCEFIGYCTGRLAAEKKEDERMQITVVTGYLLAFTSIAAGKKLQQIMNK